MESKIFTIIILSFLFFFLIDLISGNYFDCHIKAINSDKYCKEFYPSNASDYKIWELRSHGSDSIEEERNRIETEKLRTRELEEKNCYDIGYGYNRSFDIIEDYNLSCEQIGYINDHLIDEKTSGGYIRGSYNGFLSYGRIEGESYVIQEVLATGMLVQSLSYHVDCNKEKSGEVVDYYVEPEFVLYYVERCLE